MLFIFLLLVVAVIAAAGSDAPISLAEFTSSLPLYKQPAFVLFCDFEETDTCEGLKANFDGVIDLQRPAFVEIRFVFVKDFFGMIKHQLPYLSDLPRVQYYDREGKPQMIAHFQTSKQGKYAFERFLHRAIAPTVFRLHNEQQLDQFLHPSTDELRDAEVEDPVSFILVEPETGSAILRGAYSRNAAKFATKAFFAHIRLGEYEGDWTTPCNLHATPLSLPAILRVETHEPGIVVSEFGEANLKQLIPTRLLFPTRIDLQNHNFRLVWDAALQSKIILVLGLYSTTEQRDEWHAKFAVEQPPGLDGPVWFATIDRITYHDFLVQFVEDTHSALALNRSAQAYWPLSEEQQQELSQWLTRVQSGQESAWATDGYRMLLRLAVKALSKSTKLQLQVLGLVCALFLAALSIALVCTMPSYSKEKTE